MAIDIANLTREFFEEVWHKGNVDFISTHCTPDFRYHDVLSADLDREGFKQFVRTIRNAFPDVRFRLDEILVSGDSATVRWTATGTNRGEILGNPATNRSGSVTGIEIIRMSGEKQREQWVNWDVYGMLRNLGMAPQLGAGVSPGVQPPAEAAKPGAEARRH